MIEMPREIEVMAMTTKVQEKFPRRRENNLLARKNPVFNEKKSLLCKSKGFFDDVS
jgi:hypothetical protein